jgi:hypothetical protein
MVLISDNYLLLKHDNFEDFFEVNNNLSAIKQNFFDDVQKINCHDYMTPKCPLHRFKSTKMYNLLHFIHKLITIKLLIIEQDNSYV